MKLWNAWTIQNMTQVKSLLTRTLQLFAWPNHMDSSSYSSLLPMMLGIPLSPISTCPLSIHWRRILAAPLSSLASWLISLSCFSRFTMWSLYSFTLLSFSLLTASMTCSNSNWSRISAYVLLLLLPAFKMWTPRPLVATKTNNALELVQVHSI